MYDMRIEFMGKDRRKFALLSYQHPSMTNTAESPEAIIVR